MKTFSLETKWTNRESELVLVSRSSWLNTNWGTDNEHGINGPASLPSLPVISLSRIKDYAQASGDFNPIHTDPEAARLSGFPASLPTVCS